MKILYVGMCTGENGFTKAMRKYCDYKEINCGITNVNEHIIGTCQEWKPDLVFFQVQTPNIIKIQTLLEIAALDILAFNFTGDVRAPLPDWYLELAPHFTSTLFTNMNDVNTVRDNNWNSDFLNNGFDPEIYKPEGEIKVVPPIIFMGNNYGAGYFPLSQERIDTVYALKKEFGTEFGLYGNGWNNVDGNFNHSQVEEAAVYRGAKIAINLSHFEYEDYSSDRLLRILGTGTMCISKWYPGIDKIPLMYYKDWKELFELCDLFLSDTSHRQILAKAGGFYAHHSFTFDHMVQNIIKLYDKYK